MLLLGENAMTARKALHLADTAGAGLVFEARGRRRQDTRTGRTETAIHFRGKNLVLLLFSNFSSSSSHVDLF
jgi:hypothetical protein